jgi:translation elongation factor EF-1beta
MLNLGVRDLYSRIPSFFANQRLDDETDMKALEAAVRGIEKDGLVWGASTLVAVGFGIKKLQINLVIEDDKISLDELQEEISEFEDYVQSTDIVSINSTQLYIPIVLTSSQAAMQKL